MKCFLLSLFLVVGLSGFSQYNDTLYFKSGYAKAVTVRKYDAQFLYYEYGNKKGKLVDNRIPLSKLDSFVIYNEFNELIYDSKKEARKEE